MSKIPKSAIPPRITTPTHKFKFLKFIFTFLALFYYQINYSETHIPIIKKSEVLYNAPSEGKEKHKPTPSLTNNEKKLKNFERSVNDETSLEGFSFHEKQYSVNFPIDMVWDTYKNTKPNECWSSQLAAYKKSYTNSSFHNFSEENHPSFKEGSIYLIRLKLIPFVKITVVFQLTKLDTSNKIIELTYGMNNKSHGKQTIQFIEDGDKTIIKHTSYFKSKSKFRDKHLYPKFHEKYIDVFHATIQKKINDISDENHKLSFTLND